jgi:hypothetical protein
MLPSGRPQTCHFLGMIPGPRRTGGASAATETREKGEIFHLEMECADCGGGEIKGKLERRGSGISFCCRWAQGSVEPNCQVPPRGSAKADEALDGLGRMAQQPPTA